MKLRVKEICKAKGLLMEDLANKLGIARVNLTKTINGNPTIETLERIADALSVSIIDLFEPESEFYGIIQYKGVTYRIDGFEAFKRLFNDVSGNMVFVANCPECKAKFDLTL